MALLDDLKTALGAAHVLTGKDRAPYLNDWTQQYTSDPVAVIRPANTQEVSEAVKLCAAAKMAVVPVSGNTGLMGGAFTKDGVLISMERMNKIRAIHAEARTATVDAGVILSNLHDAVDAEEMIFPLILGAKGSALIGGCLSTNAGGSNVLRYGNTRALCLGLEVVLPDGRIMDLMSALHKDNSGYDLKDLFIGAEGTLGLITGAVLKLFPKPLAYATAMVAVPSLDDALVLLNRVQAATSGAVEAYEYMTRGYIDKFLELHPEGRAPFEERYDVNILIEAATTSAALGRAREDGVVPLNETLEAILGEMLENGAVLDAVVAQNETQRAEMWDRRDAAAEIILTGKPMVDNDVAVPVEKVSAFLDTMRVEAAKIDPKIGEMVVAHLGDGNIHYTLYPSDPDFNLPLREKVEDVTRSLGGSFSAEHGIGLTKLGSMTRRKDATALDVMRTIKTALDPDNIMNPGKVVPEV
jgi:FAD/FMN-containing dehydrogenase